MSKKTQVTLFIASIIIQVLSLIFLATDAALLSQSVIAGGGLPWGNLLTALLFTLFPINFLLVRRHSYVHPVPAKTYYFFVCAGAICGFLWLFVSYFLSGNWSASFHGEDTRSAIWYYYTYLTPLLPFMGYFLMRFLMIFFKNVSRSG